MKEDVPVNFISEKDLDGTGRAVIPLRPLDAGAFERWKSQATPAQVRWAQNAGFTAAAGEVCALPDADGSLECTLFGVQDEGAITQLGALVGRLPPGVYRLASDWPRERRVLAALGWGLATYRFERYKAATKELPRLVLEDDIDAEVRSLHTAQCLVRDLVNTPTEHMGPRELADAVTAQADAFDAECRSICGDDLLTRDFPAIHAVGRASNREPRLVELQWGDEEAPLVALVGKGVCFDTGGLDLKPASGMALMKKDMGGAAHALALARLVMEARLPVRLLLLIPAVENAVSGNAYRPGDIIATRKGLHVEIGNTDAEGRVILSDALAYACEHDPDLVVDFATLTGAARVALGADLPPLFSNREDVAQAIQQAGGEVEDPLWTLPLYRPYRKLIESPIADINNAGKSSFAGCITAALFLEHFVSDETPWVHIDTFAWNESDRPARPQGGEALGLRAVFRYLQQRYGRG
jgi:leucyl aminopeptidase